MGLENILLFKIRCFNFNFNVDTTFIVLRSVPSFAIFPIRQTEIANVVLRPLNHLQFKLGNGVFRIQLFQVYVYLVYLDTNNKKCIVIYLYYYKVITKKVNEEKKYYLMLLKWSCRGNYPPSSLNITLCKGSKVFTTNN